MVCGRSTALRKWLVAVPNCSSANATMGTMARSPYRNGRRSRVCRSRSSRGSPNTMKKRPMLLPSGLPGVTNEPTHSTA